MKQDLAVKDEQVRGVIASLSQISSVKKCTEVDLEPTEEEVDPSQPSSF